MISKFIQEQNGIIQYKYNFYIYTYKIDYEYTLIAAYLGDKNITNQVAHILNTSNDGNINNNVLTNYKFYNNQIQASQKLDCSNKLVQRILGEDIIFNSSSACLLQKEDKSGYHLNIRYVNYEITKTGSYLNCDKYIITIKQIIIPPIVNKSSIIIY
jgi:hypothetical protein